MYNCILYTFVLINGVFIKSEKKINVDGDIFKSIIKTDYNVFYTL